MSDEKLIGHLPDFLHQPTQLRPLHAIWYRVDHSTYLGAITVRDRREQLSFVPLLEAAVGPFEHDRRVCCRQVRRIRDGAGVVDDLFVSCWPYRSSLWDLGWRKRWAGIRGSKRFFSIPEEEVAGDMRVGIEATRRPG